MGTRRCQARRKGIVVVLVAFLLVVIVGVLALALDVGYLYVVKEDLQTAADSAALAGASGLSISQDEARNRAYAYAKKNRANRAAVVLQPSDVELGQWDPSTRTFTPTGSSPGAQPSAVKVTAQLRESRGNAVGLFFARVLGVNSSDVAATAIGAFGARDVVLSLDYSASMSYDSQLRHIAELGRPAVEQSLLDIWHSLGSPTYGKMQFTPVYLSSTDSATILKTLGLGSVSYPYPNSAYMDPTNQKIHTCTRGWSDYFSYVQGTAIARNENKTIVNDPHYRKYYGYMTLVDYFQAVQYRAAPDGIALWQTPQQPITAVKDAVSLFLDYMQHPRTDDRVGLTAFTFTDGTSKREVPLSTDYTLLETTSRQRQAGHYHNQTNISAGIEAARDELAAQTRTGAQRLIVLLSDGRTNWLDNNHTANETAAKNAALQQARFAARDKVPILTISLGADADLDLMQQIADITGGTHFIVPGGRAVSDYRDQLFAVFAKIALQRPLKLVY
jgi:Mg-chelatase subunit ChlD